MSNTYSTLGSLFTAIANAIRAKTGSSASIVADDFPTEIANIPSGGGTLITKSITANGIYNAEDDDADGYSSVTVNVQSGGSDFAYSIPILTGTVHIFSPTPITATMEVN